LTASWQRQRLFEALARALLTLNDPLLLFLDDLQWCDHDTLEWLHYLLRFAPQAPLLLVGTVRSAEVADDHPLSALLLALRRDGILTELSLGPLDAPETLALATAVAGQPLTPEQGADLYQETEGNPLFVVETVRAKGNDWSQASQPQATSATRQTLPPKVHAVLQARLAQLSPAARDLASLAATIGRAFSFAVLAQASAQDDDALVRTLDELWQRRIVRERGGDAYDFTHDKLREVAYTSLSAARRHLLHRAVAQALVAIASDQPLSTAQSALDAVSGQIATHYELAGLYEAAIPYYQRAAAAAAHIYTNSEAIRYYRRTLALLEGPANGAPALTATICEQLGDLLHLTGHYDEARGDYGRALALLPPDAGLGRGRLQRKTGNTWREQYQYAAALQAYQSAETQLTGVADPTASAKLVASPAPEAAAWWEELLQLWLDLDMVYYWLGRLEESHALRQRLEAAVVQHGSPAKRASFYQHRALLALRSNRSVATPEMVADCRAALAALQENGNAAAIPAAQFLLGFFCLWQGAAQTALEPLQTALQLAQQTGDVNLEARCLTYLTIAYRQTEQVDKALHYAGLSLAAATTAHMPEYVGMAQANQAWVAWRHHQPQAVEAHGQAALAQWQQLPATHASLPFQWTVLWPLLAVALTSEALTSALDYAQRLLDPCQQRLPDPLATLLTQANTAWTRNEPAEARQYLTQAVALAQRLHYL
jgi:hypothetical protein